MSLTATDLETIIEPATEPERQTAIDSEGFAYDIQTGEVLGHAEVHERFEVQTKDAADFVLQLRSEIEGKIAGLAARKTAINQMLDSQIQDARRRLSWWEWRFGASLTTFARSVLAGRNRTAKFEWGQVSFRKSPGTTQVIDDEAALRFVETWAPDKVKVVRTVNISAIKAAVEIARAALGEDEIDTPFLAASGESENVTITTGIQIDGGKR